MFFICFIFDKDERIVNSKKNRKNLKMNFGLLFGDFSILYTFAAVIMIVRASGKDAYFKAFQPQLKCLISSGNLIGTYGVLLHPPTDLLRASTQS